MSLSFSYKGISFKSDSYIGTAKATSIAKKLGIPQPTGFSYIDLSGEWELTKDTIIRTTANKIKYNSGEYKGKTTEFKGKTVYFGNYQYNSKGVLEKAIAYKVVSEKSGINQYGEAYNEISIGEKKDGANLDYTELLDISSQGPIMDVNGFNKGDDGFAKIKQQYAKYLPEGWQQKPWGANILIDEGVSTSSGIVSTSDSSVSAYDKYYSALTSGNASTVSKQINWKELDISTATTDFYQALDWKSVNMSLLQKFQSSGINWGKVQYQEFSVTQYTQTNWSQVDISQLSDANYDSIDWGRVAYKGTKSVNYSQLSWSKVDFGDFSIATFKQVDWSQVKTSELTSEQYSEIKWGSVSFSGKTSINYASLDWSQVITASGFNAAAYKSVNWAQVDFSDFKQQTFATTNWNQVNFKQLSTSQYQAINWNEINLGALSTKTYQAIDWKKVNVAAFDSESISTAKWGLMKGVTKPTAAAKPAEADLSFLGVTAPAGTTAGLVGAAGQSSSNQLIGALTGTKQGQVLPT